MSALPPITDIRQCGCDVRRVPIGDMPVGLRVIAVIADFQRDAVQEIAGELLNREAVAAATVLKRL